MYSVHIPFIYNISIYFTLYSVDTFTILAYSVQLPLFTILVYIVQCVYTIYLQY